MKVLVCGGRDFGRTMVECKVFARTLDKLHEDRPFSLVIHGACGVDADGKVDFRKMRDADRLAHDWATSRGVPANAHPAAWSRLGPSAGPVRNREMLEMGPDLVIAFPGGRGTEHMTQIARDAAVEMMVVTMDVVVGDLRR